MIYLVRHGETALNREGRLQGRMESELTALGKRQACAVAELLDDLIRLDPPAPWRIISSPLGRTMQTAGIIGERLLLPIETDGRLTEIDVGEWQGRLRDEMAAVNTQSVAEREWYFRAPSGETYEDVMARVRGWLSEQVDEEHRRLIVVSHAVAGRLLRGAYAGLKRETAIAQDVPQDAVYRLSRGQIDRFDCDEID
jgi:broad specificity phosphatase PhoE